MPNSRPLEKITAQDFSALTGTSFRLTAGPPDGAYPAAFDLELVEVTESPDSAASGARRVPFSLLFHGPLEPVAPQAIYRFEHDQLGELELFAVPIGPAGPAAAGQPPMAMRYEVVFA